MNASVVLRKTPATEQIYIYICSDEYFSALVYSDASQTSPIIMNTFMVTKPLKLICSSPFYLH